MPNKDRGSHSAHNKNYALDTTEPSYIKNKIIPSNINDRVQFHTVLFHRCHLCSVYYLGQSNVPSALLFYDPGVSKRKGNVLRIHKGINL